MKENKLKFLGVFFVGILIGFGSYFLVDSKLTTEDINRGVEPNMIFTNASKKDTEAKRIFLNASENTDGNTSKMAKKLFGGLSYTQINLAEYSIPQIGQGTGDFEKIFDQISEADILVVGTPVYWSNMSGYLKTFIDHMEINDSLKNTDLYAIVQGSDSDQHLAAQSTYGTLNRIATRFEMNFVGLATNNNDIKDLSIKLGR